MIFKQFRSRFTRKLEIACTDYYRQKVDDCRGDQKQLYNVINSLLKPTSVTPLPDHVTSFELANRFNSYFLDKVIKIRDDLDSQVGKTTSIERSSSTVTHKFEVFKLVTPDKVRQYIAKSPSKHCKSDPIPTWLLKECVDELLPFITCMLNCSLQNGTFSDHWKDAIVMPLMKKAGAGTNLANYRPVSNLSFISKLVERVVVDQLTSHMHVNAPLPAYQSAYRQHHSTETVLSRVTSDIFQCMGKQQVALMVLLDLSAAFDTVDHQILLNIMQRDFGLDNSVLNWLASYLSNRSQRVMISDILSDKCNINFGVPQGSCLGPVLFTAYSSSLFQVINKHLVYSHGYADDTQLVKVFSPRSNDQILAIECIEDCVSDIQNWMLQHRLKLNDNKTEVIFLVPNNNLLN